MKKLLTTALVSALAFTSVAQAEWVNTELPMANKDGKVHAALVKATATIVTQNAIAISCFGGKTPLISIEWPLALNADLGTVNTKVYVDGRTFRDNLSWNIIGNKFVVASSDNPEVIKTMKRGNTMTVEYRDDKSMLKTEFDLRGFTNAYNEVRNKCLK